MSKRRKEKGWREKKWGGKKEIVISATKKCFSGHSEPTHWTNYTPLPEMWEEGAGTWEWQEKHEKRAKTGPERILYGFWKGSTLGHKTTFHLLNLVSCWQIQLHGTGAQNISVWFPENTASLVSGNFSPIPHSLQKAQREKPITIESGLKRDVAFLIWLFWRPEAPNQRTAQ